MIIIVNIISGSIYRSPMIIIVNIISGSIYRSPMIIIVNIISGSIYRSPMIIIVNIISGSIYRSPMIIIVTTISDDKGPNSTIGDSGIFSMINNTTLDLPAGNYLYVHSRHSILAVCIMIDSQLYVHLYLDR